MDGKRTSILSDLKRNYGDTKSISKSVDLSALENNANPHQIYNSIFKDVDTTPTDYPTEKMAVGDIVYINDNPNEQFEIINMNDKNNISLKNLSNNEIISKTQKDIKKIMENIDMAKKKINETQYSVSINGLETTDANALSQMMSAAAQADSGNADVGGMDMTSTPDLPTPENTIETLPQDDMGSLDSNINMEPEMDTTVVASDTIDTDEPSFEDSNLEGIDNELPSDVENPLDNPESEMDSFEDDFDMGSEMDMDEPVVDDIEFDEEITPSEDETEIDDMEITESEEPLKETYNSSYETIKKDYLNGFMSDEEAISALLDCGKASTKEEAIDILNGFDNEGWFDDSSDVYISYGKPNLEKDEELDESKEDNAKLYSDDKLARYEDTFGKDEENSFFVADINDEYIQGGFKTENEAQEWIWDYCNKNALDPNDYIVYDELEMDRFNGEELDEDILLPKATEDETFNASKKLKDEDDEESERISESMDALIKSILENADAKSEQEIYAEEISEEKDDSKCCPKCGKEKCICKDEEILDEDNDEFDVEISEALRNAGVKLEEATVKPTIVTDESSFANKPNKALKPEDKKTVEKKTVDTATFSKDASEGFKEPLNCIKCEAVSPKEKIKAIYETAKVRYSKANKDEWNALDRRYIKKLIENGCGYTRASKIILEAKKKK